MTKRIILTKEQHRELYNQEFKTGNKFNPFLDADGNICLSEEEVKQVEKSEFQWVKEKETELKKESEILKTNWTKQEWIDYEIAEAEKRKTELEKLKVKK